MTKIRYAWLLALLCSAAWAQGQPTPVIVTTATAKAVELRHEALATVLANESVDISAAVAETLDVVHFQEGQRVERGDLLAELTHAEEDAALAAARARERERRSALGRVQELHDQKLASAADLELAQAGLDAAIADVRARQAERDDRLIRAPFSGVLGIREVSAGAYLRAGDRLTQLTDRSRLKLEFMLPQAWLGLLDQPFTMVAWQQNQPEQRFPLSLQSLDQQLDPSTRGLRLRAALEAVPGLRPGSLMLVAIESQPRQAVMLPEAALVPGGRGQSLYRVVDGMAEKVAVSIGLRRQGEVEIVEGIDAGDAIVVHGMNRLRPGEAVRVTADYDGTTPIAELIRQQSAQP